MREAQRHRILLAAAETVQQTGVACVTVAAIVSRAGVSRRTFYELFEGCEDCLLEAFEETVAQARATVVPAYEREQAWQAQIRSALAALLAFLDEHPAPAKFMVVDALGCGPAALTHRAAAVAGMIDAVDRGRALARSQKGLSRTTAEGLVGGALSIVHTRMLGGGRVSLTPLLGPLMSMLVRPYLGAAAAAAELERDPPPPPPRPRRPESAVVSEVRMRWTYRTMLVLNAIARQPDASNRQIASIAGILDQGQASKLLTRLEGLGLIVNRGTRPRKAPNAWRLTAKGAELEAVFGRQVEGGGAH